MTDDRASQAAAGVVAVRGMVAEWQAARAELRALEEAEHPPFRDQWGRLWTWFGRGDTWHHDDTLAYPRDMIGKLRGLPNERYCRRNPNYWRLCETCRSQWADRSPVSPRVRLGDRWYDVRDGLFYAELDEDAAALARWEADGGA